MIRNLVRTKLWQSCACVSSRYHSSTISTVHQILNYDISDALVANRPELVRKKKVNRSTQFKMLEDKFKELFSFSQEEAVKLVDTNKSTWKIPLAKINANIDCLHKKNVRAQSIVDNLWLLGVPTKYLEEKLQLIEQLQPRDINDFVPLIRVSTPILSRTQTLVLHEANLIPERHRIYYFSQRLEVEPAQVAKAFANNMFMFEIAFDSFERNLNFMLVNGTSSNVLNNLSIFKSSTESIQAHLPIRQRTSNNLKPLLFNCPGNLFETNSTNERKQPELENSMIELLSERLGYDFETTKSMLNKRLMRVPVTKVKNILDYLLIDEKFKPIEVGSSISIIGQSLETIKKRINEMKEHGCRPSSLSTVCQSQSEYNKYLQRWIEKRKKF